VATALPCSAVRRFLLPLIGLLLIVATGCQARTSVEIDVESNGSGSVAVTMRLDEDAAAAVPRLAEQLRTSDLQSAGWNIDGPDQDDAGETVIIATHHFGNAGEANVLLRQLTGETGPLSSLQMTQTKSFTSIDVEVAGVADLTRGIESFGDEQLKQRVGTALGFDPAEVTRSLGVDWAKTFPIDVTVDLPGGKTANAQLVYGSATPVSAAASATNVWALTFSAFSVLLLLGAVLSAILWKSGKYRPKHRKKVGGGGIRARDLLAHGKEFDEAEK
jgi:hypothetical protein